MCPIFPLHEKFFDFIDINKDKDVYSLKLSAPKSFSKEHLDFALIQIECRRAVKAKIPTFLKNHKFLFPSRISAEQASHEAVARYHAELIGTGKKVADLTAGLGLDAMTMALAGNHVTAFDVDEFKIEILRHNAKALGLLNLNAVHENSIDYLASNPTFKADIVYVDPARRDNKAKRVFRLDECEPDVVKNFELLKNAAIEKIIIKASPLLDLSMIIRQLPSCSEIHIVSVKGECKETLIIIENGREKKPDEEVKICAVNIEGRDIIEKLDFYFSELNRPCPVVEIENIKPGTYIYDTNAGLHKLRIGGRLCEDFEGLRKLSLNSELYFSEYLYKDFPGRIFRIEKIIDYKRLKKGVLNNFEIISRNYPLSAENLRQELKIKGGSDEAFLIFTKVGTHEKKMIAISKKVFLE